MTTQQAGNRLDLSKVDCRLAISDDPPPGDYPIKMHCPMHKDREASLAVYRGGLKCFGCKFEIRRRLDALAFLLTGRYDESTVRELIRDRSRVLKYTAEAVDGYRERVAAEDRRTPLPSALADVYQRILATSRQGSLQALLRRGLSEGIVTKAVIGHSLRYFTIPFYDSTGALITIRFRRDELYGECEFDGCTPIPKYKGYEGRNGQYLYPESWCYEAVCFGHRTATLWICEGELDALRLWDVGVAGCSTTNGSRNMVKAVELITRLIPGCRSIVVCGDIDEPGLIARKETLQAAKAAGYEAREVMWPGEWGKDITEVLLNHTINEVETWTSENYISG